MRGARWVCIPVGYTESIEREVDYVDACREGRTLPTSTSSRSTSTALAIPFPFRVFDRTYDGVWPDLRGFARLDDTVGITVPGAGAIPSQTTGPLLAPFMHSLRWQYQNVRLCVALLGVAPNRRLVVEWRSADSLRDFELVLHETTNIIEYAYALLPPARTVRDAVVGFQSLFGDAFAVHPGPVPNPAVIRYTPR
jgi:hypothetical protein